MNRLQGGTTGELEPSITQALSGELLMWVLSAANVYSFITLSAGPSPSPGFAPDPAANT
jgi:hypothetical protein